MRESKLSKAAKIVARAGGVATLKKHGIKHYKKMAKIRWTQWRADKAIAEFKTAERKIK